MAAPASHQINPIQTNPEMPGIEAMGAGRPISEEMPITHDYGIYVLEGTRHPDGSSGLIFSFNPNILPIKDRDTHRIARNIHLSLLPLKRRERELRSEESGKEVPEKDLDFKVEASEAPIKVIRNGHIVEGDSEETMDILFAEGEEDKEYTVMHGWPAVRLNYDTSLIDHTSVVKAVSYVLSSHMSASEQDVWVEDLSTDVNIESLLDMESIRPGNTNEHVRKWVRELLREEELGSSDIVTDEDRPSPRLSRIAASLSSLVKIS